MDARDLVRSVRAFGSARGMRGARAAWRRQRSDSAAFPPAREERARVPGAALGAEPVPGGAVVRFARSSLLVRVAAGGAVFCGWDGAGPEPSYALAGRCPDPDPRAGLEPDTGGGWRVVSERVMVTVSRHGVVTVGTPGGVVLRRDQPPRWWEAVGGPGPARWAQHSQVAADARFFGLGGREAGPRLRGGEHRLWNGGAAAGPERHRRGTAWTGPAERGAEGPEPLTMPVQLVVADVGTHLVFHDNSWEGRIRLREGTEGLGSGHDRPGRAEIRMTGGPVRYWVMTGTPSRVLQAWAALAGAPAPPPRWALGYQHEGPCTTEAEVRGVAEGFRERDLPLRALHLGSGHQDGGRVFTVDRRRFPGLPELARELRTRGVRLVPAVQPGVRADAGCAVHDSGAAAGVFVRDARGREVRGVPGAGESVFPDFTDRRVRKWWGGLYAEGLAHGFSGVRHDRNEPGTAVPFGEPTLPRSARHTLEGRGGDHREAHNVYALAMARAGHQGLRELRPEERPFLLSRSGWAGLQRYGGTWYEPARADWRALRASLSLTLGLGLCGVPYSGPYIGGGRGPLSAELYLRWFQLGAYLPLFCTHGPGRGQHREPWAFGPGVLEHARSALARRAELLPYFATLARVAERTGAPYVRPLWWQHSRDRGLRDCEDAFLLGDALLVAPVLEQGVTARTVRLPRGGWHDTATGERFQGPGRVELTAPPERIPVLARAGAAIPVADGEGGIALEVWSPDPGRTGSGLVIRDTEDGWEPPRVERLRVGLVAGRPVVTGEDGAPTTYRVRIRG